MILALLFGLLFATPEPPVQPIAFSHEVHAGKAKLDCKTCHTNPAPGEMMTFPAEAKCMACHRAIKTDSPEIQRLAKFFEDKKRIPWVRVYQVPTYVFWSHKTHLDAGATCQECHGDVATMPAMFKAVETNMGSCMTCHAKKRVSNDCQFCHDKAN